MQPPSGKKSATGDWKHWRKQTVHLSTCHLLQWAYLSTQPRHRRRGPDLCGVLHCPAYRETYAEFLKIDFPRIPWPAILNAFRRIVGKEQCCANHHLMDRAAVGEAPYPFKDEGNGILDNPNFPDGYVRTNETQ